MCLILFVYGTLKRGFWNHEADCADAISIREATVRGRLYELPSGIPVLEVHEMDILAHGSMDILGDLALQRHDAVMVRRRSRWNRHIMCQK